MNSSAELNLTMIYSQDLTSGFYQVADTGFLIGGSDPVGGAKVGCSHSSDY